MNGRNNKFMLLKDYIKPPIIKQEKNKSIVRLKSEHI